MSKDTTLLNLIFRCANGQPVKVTVRKPKEDIDGAMLHGMAQSLVQIGVMSDTHGSPIKELSHAQLIRKVKAPIKVRD